jgi:hypothetical protein
MGPEANILSPPPLHPSLMALDDESHFSEAAFLIDMLCVMSSDQPVPTPGEPVVCVIHDLSCVTFDLLQEFVFCFSRFR